MNSYPDNISNIRIPIAHQSTLLPYPLLLLPLTISGAKYSGVPNYNI